MRVLCPCCWSGVAHDHRRQRNDKLASTARLRDTPKLDCLRGFKFDQVFATIKANREAGLGPTSVDGAANSTAPIDPELRKAATALSRQVMSVSRTQMGSSGQRASLRGDCLGLAAHINLFEVFFTASPSDTTTMRVQVVHGGEERDISDLVFGAPHTHPSYLDRAKHVTRDPFGAARWFLREIENFFRVFIRVDLRVGHTCGGVAASTGLSGEQGIFGIVTGHAGSGEASGKGSNHGHWCLGCYGCGPNRLDEQLADARARACLISFKESIVSQRLPRLCVVDGSGDRPVARTTAERKQMLAGCLGSGADLLALFNQASSAPNGADLYEYGSGCFPPSLVSGPMSSCEKHEEAMNQLAGFRYGISLIPPPDPDKFWLTPSDLPPLSAGDEVWFKHDYERRDTRRGFVAAVKDDGDFLVTSTGSPQAVEVPQELVRPVPASVVPGWRESFARDDSSNGIVLQACGVVPGGLSGPVWHEVVCSEGACIGCTRGVVLVHRVEYVQVERLHIRGSTGGLERVEESGLRELLRSKRPVLVPGGGVDDGGVACTVLGDSNVSTPSDVHWPCPVQDKDHGFCYARVRHRAAVEMPYVQLRKFNSRLFLYELALREALAVESVEIHDCTPGCFKMAKWASLAEMLCRMGYPQPLVTAALQSKLAQGIALSPGRGKGRGCTASRFEIFVSGLVEGQDASMLHSSLGSASASLDSAATVVKPVSTGGAGGAIGFMSFYDETGARLAIDALTNLKLRAEPSRRQVKKDLLATAPPVAPVPVYMGQADSRLVVPSNRLSLACTATNQCSKLMSSGEDSKVKVCVCVASAALPAPPPLGF